MLKHLLAIGFLGLFVAAVTKSNKPSRRRPGDDPVAEFHAHMAEEAAAPVPPAVLPASGLVRRDAEHHAPHGVN